MPPRALTPSGVILVDKPAGPTSFAIVAAILLIAPFAMLIARPIRQVDLAILSQV